MPTSLLPALTITSGILSKSTSIPSALSVHIPQSHQQRRRMARYRLLPNKEHDHIDAEAATPSSNGPAVIKSKLWKYISALASFLLICIIITLVAFVPTNHHLLSTEAVFAEDLSFLSTFSSTEHPPYISQLICFTSQLPPDPSPKRLPSTRDSGKDPRQRATKHGAASSQVHHISPHQIAQ